MPIRKHLSEPVLRNVASFFRKMSGRDQRAFLFIWDQWIRVIAHLRQHLYETQASASLATILSLQKHLNLPFLFDIEDAVYVRGVATGQIARDDFPLPGSNSLTWPASHVTDGEVAVGDVLTLVFGAVSNLSDFEISAVSDTGITTVEVFNAETAPLVDYRVDSGVIPDSIFVGCSEVYKIPAAIKSIPLLTTTIGPNGYSLVEGADYVIKDGFIGFYNRGPGQYEDGQSFFFAATVIEDEELPFRNFGFPIGFRQDSSEEYVRGLQALWFALWNGPALSNIEVGVSVIFGLPFTVPGRVESIARTADGGWEVVIVGADRVAYALSPGFPPNVEVGQSVGFQSLTDAARVADYIEEPSFIELFDLNPRVTKFHSFFVIIAFEVLQQIQEDGGLVDFAPVVDFVDRIKAVRTDFMLLVEIKIPEELPLSAETPVVDVVVRAHALMGANPANLTSIDSFGSPGYAQPHGYADHYVERSEMTGTVLEVRDSADELIVSWDEGATKETPDDGVMSGKFVIELDSSLRESGSADLGGNTLILSQASFDFNRFAVGDVILATDSVEAVNQEAFTITEIVIGGLTFTLTLNRVAVVELGRAIKVYRFYDLVLNEGGVLRLVTAQLALDGLDLVAPGSFKVWRRLIGGRQMYSEYADQVNTGRFAFGFEVDRLPFDFDQDAVQLVDRIRISTLDADGVVTEKFDDRDVLGDVSGPAVVTTLPTTATPTTVAPTTPAPTTVAPTTAAPTTPAPTTAAPTTAGALPLPSDDFSGGDDPDIDGRTMSDGQNTWAKVAGVIGILSGEAESTTVGPAYYLASSMTDMADLNVQYKFVTHRHGVMARMDATAQNGYVAYIETSQVQLFKIVAGAFVLLGNVASGAGAGNIVRLECIGTTIRVYVNGVLKIDVTDAAHATGKAGIWSDVVSQKLDDFAVSPA